MSTAIKVWVFLFCPLVPSLAQPPAALLRYAAEQARLARQANQLEQWGWIQVELIEQYPDDDPQRALDSLDRTLSRRWRPPADSAENEPFLYLHTYRGYYLSATGRIWQAVQAYEQAAALFARYRYTDPDFEVVEMVYKPLGNHYTRLGDNEKALVVFQKALQQTAAGNAGDRAGLYNNIGLAHWNAGDLAEAENAYRTGLGLPSLPPLKRALLLTGLARAQLDGGRMAPAAEHAAAALRLLAPLRRTDPQAREYAAYAARTAGLAELFAARLDEAERLLRAALADAEKTFGPHSREVGKTWLVLAECHRRAGRLPEAMEAANRALRAVLPSFNPRRAEENPSPATFYEENTIFEALGAKAAAAEALYRRNGAERHLLLALACHDLARQAEVLLRKTFQYQSSKLELQNTARQREEAAMNVVRLLYEKTGRAEYRTRGFALSERSKAALLQEALHENLIRQRLAGSDTRFEQLTALRRSMAYFQRSLLISQAPEALQWRRELDDLSTRAAALERALLQAYPHLAVPGASGATGTPAGDAVAYFAGSAALDIFVLKNGVPTAWERRPYDTVLQNLVQRFSACFERADALLADPEGYLKTAYALWQKIMPQQAAAAPALTVFPDGFLNFIPLEALVTAAPAPGTTLRNAAYLIRQQRIRYAWSLATLQQQEALPSGAPEFFLGLAPRFQRGERGLPPLPGGAAEWGGHGGLLDGAATCVAFLAAASQYRVLHLCTHARADLHDSLPPRIELYDAALWLPDIYALALHADLVVLSACQTGIGAEQKGEGVMSLARAFGQSGAACVVSTLWTVNDRGNLRLFQDFYRHTKAGESVAAALRSAKLNYLNDPGVPAVGQTPYYWAGAVAIGADRALREPSAWRPLWWAVVGFGVVFAVFWWKFRWKKAAAASKK